MKTYAIDNTNWEEVLEQVSADVATDFVGATVNSVKYGTGEVVAASVVFKSVTEPMIACDIKFIGNTRTFYMNIGLAMKALTMAEEYVTIIDKYMTTLNTIATFREEKVREAERLAEEAHQAEVAAKKEAAEAEKFEAKLKIHQEKIMQTLKAIKTKKVSLDDDFYTALGWLAKHVGTISANIPDFAENWFEGKFGTDAPKMVVDSRRKTSGGYSMKWNPSFSISLKNVTNIPSLIERKSLGKNKINDTEFVFDLIENYGFKFGKEQDIDSILDTVPANKLSKFQEGYAA